MTHTRGCGRTPRIDSVSLVLIRVSPNFSLNELIRTNVRAPNSPDIRARDYLTILATTVLEPIRNLYIPQIGRTVGPWIVESGYRSPMVNARVGGAANSAHMEGRAADGYANDPDCVSALVMCAIVASDIQFDKVIYERPGDWAWIHIQIPKHERAARRQALICPKLGMYENWRVDHPRIVWIRR